MSVFDDYKIKNLINSLNERVNVQRAEWTFNKCEFMNRHKQILVFTLIFIVCYVRFYFIYFYFINEMWRVDRHTVCLSVLVVAYANYKTTNQSKSNSTTMSMATRLLWFLNYT